MDRVKPTFEWWEAAKNRIGTNEASMLQGAFDTLFNIQKDHFITTEGTKPGDAVKINTSLVGVRLVGLKENMLPDSSVDSFLEYSGITQGLPDYQDYVVLMAKSTKSEEDLEPETKYGFLIAPPKNSSSPQRGFQFNPQDLDDSYFHARWGEEQPAELNEKTLLVLRLTLAKRLVNAMYDGLFASPMTKEDVQAFFEAMMEEDASSDPGNSDPRE